MIALLLISACASAAAPGDALPAVPLSDACRVRFAGVAEGRRALSLRDAFVNSLSPLERQIRLRSAQEVSTDELIAHAQKQVLPWPEKHRRRLGAIVDSLRRKLAPLRLSLPDEVLLVHTSGREEAGAAYTRGNAIILPGGKLAGRDVALKRLLAHELFHVMSRHDAALRRELYAIVGFRPCGEVSLPDELNAVKLTNPDAPAIDHYITVDHDGRSLDVVPILLSKHPSYDPQRAETLFDHLQFRLLAIERNDGTWRPKLREGTPILIDGAGNRSYRRQIGRNTGYIIHPDEILADNFVHLVMQTRKLPTPRIVDKMRTVLTASERRPSTQPRRPK